MKRMFKYFFILFLFFPFIVNASSQFYNAWNSANSYYKKYETSTKYLLIKDGGLPYGYRYGALTSNSLFRTGGFVNLDEYLITQVNGEPSTSYLYDGTKYWSMTSDSGAYYIVSDKTYDRAGQNKREMLSNTERCNVRVTEYIQPEIKLKGKGTYEKPWYFVSSSEVYVEAGEHGSIASDDGKRKVVVKIVENGNDIQVVVVPDDGYKYSGNTCGGNAYYESSTGVLTISNVNKNIDCSIIFEENDYSRTIPTPTKKFNQEDGKSQTFTFSDPTPRVFYQKYGEGYYKDENLNEHITKINNIPSRIGWTFFRFKVGNETLIDKNGIFTTNYSLLKKDSVIEAEIAENENYITFDLGHGSFAGPQRQTVYYDHYYSFSNPTRTGYHFRGWSVTEGLNPDTAKTGSSASSVDTSITSSVQKSMGPYFKNINPINATNVKFVANWEPITYKIVFDLGTPGSYASASPSIVTAPSVATYDSEFQVSNPTWSGNIFTGWTITGVEGTTKGTVFKNLSATQDAVITFKANWSDVTSPSCNLVANAGSIYFGSISDNTGVASTNINGVSGTSVGIGYGTYTGTVTDTSGNVAVCSTTIYETTPYSCNAHSCNPYSCDCYSYNYDCKCVNVKERNKKGVIVNEYTVCRTCTGWGCNTCYETCYDTCYSCPDGNKINDSYCYR